MVLHSLIFAFEVTEGTFGWVFDPYLCDVSGGEQKMG